MKLLALLVALLVFCDNGFCGIPELSVDVRNGADAPIFVQAFSVGGNKRASASIPASQSQSVGRCAAITIVASGTSIPFDLPARGTRWAPKVTPEGRVRYELAYDVNIQLIFLTSPYRLEIKDEKASVQLPTGETVFLPTHFFPFPIYPRKSDLSEHERFRELSKRSRKELFRSIKQLEEKAGRNKKVAPYLDKHTKKMLEDHFGEAPE